MMRFVVGLLAAAFLALGLSSCAGVPTGGGSAERIDLTRVDPQMVAGTYEYRFSGTKHRGFGTWEIWVEDGSILGRDTWRIPGGWSRADRQTGYITPDGRLRFQQHSRVATIWCEFKGIPLRVMECEVDNNFQIWAVPQNNVALTRITSLEQAASAGEEE